jgi:hypothetical protein
MLFYGLKIRQRLKPLREPGAVEAIKIKAECIPKGV